MDPITLLATASAIWSGIKKASEFAAEAEGVFGQLSKIGAVGGIVGRKGAYAALNSAKETGK